MRDKDSSTITFSSFLLVVFLLTSIVLANEYAQARTLWTSKWTNNHLSFLADLTCTNIESKPSGFGGRHGSGDKPQSKTWYYNGVWWAVFPTTSSGASSAGTWLWKLQNNAWVEVFKLSSDQDVKADVKADGSVAHILLYAGSSTELVSVEYSGGTYIAWTGRPSGAVSIDLSGSETATIDVDSTGLMWLLTETSSSIIAYYSDSPYSNWSNSVDVATGIDDDDIGVVVAMPNNQIGVFWSDQKGKKFGFRTHTDGIDPSTWSSEETAASGSNIADDHVNVAVADDGTVFAAVKTSTDYVSLLVRRNGTWDSIVDVGDNSGVGTRPIVVLDEASDMVTFVYPAANGPNDILYKQSPMDVINFGDEMTLSSGDFNDPSSTKQNYTDSLVIIFATDKSSNNTMGGVYCTTGVSGNTPTPTATPTATDIISSQTNTPTATGISGVGHTPTATSTTTSLSTSTPTATETPVVSNTATSTETPQPTSTSTVTDTPVVSDTATPTAQSTNTPTATETATSTEIPQSASTPTATDTLVSSNTATPTATPVSDATSTVTPTVTSTATMTSVASGNTPTATATATTVSMTTDAMISPEQGGVIEGEIGNLDTTVEFAVGAVTESVTASLREEVESPDIPGVFQLLGTIFSIEAHTNSGVPVTQFNALITITINYSDIDLTGVDESKLAIYFWDIEQEVWVEIGTEVDQTNKVLHAQIDHLTTFSILETSQIYLPFTAN